VYRTFVGLFSFASTNFLQQVKSRTREEVEYHRSAPGQLLQPVLLVELPADIVMVACDDDS
jgi:hypothetical protein